MRSHGRVRAEIPARRAFLLVLLVLVLLVVLIVVVVLLLVLLVLVVVPRLRSRSGLNRRLRLDGFLNRRFLIAA